MIGYFIVVIWQLLVTEWCHWHMSGFPRGSRLTRDGIAAEAPAREAATVSGRCGFLSETPLPGSVCLVSQLRLLEPSFPRH